MSPSTSRRVKIIRHGKERQSIGHGTPNTLQRCSFILELFNLLCIASKMHRFKQSTCLYVTSGVITTQDYGESHSAEFSKICFGKQTTTNAMPDLFGTHELGPYFPYSSAVTLIVRASILPFVTASFLEASRVSSPILLMDEVHSLLLPAETLSIHRYRTSSA